MLSASRMAFLTIMRTWPGKKATRQKKPYVSKVSSVNCQQHLCIIHPSLDMKMSARPLLPRVIVTSHPHYSRRSSCPSAGKFRKPRRWSSLRSRIRFARCSLTPLLIPLFDYYIFPRADMQLHHCASLPGVLAPAAYMERQLLCGHARLCCAAKHGKYPSRDAPRPSRHV